MIGKIISSDGSQESKGEEKSFVGAICRDVFDSMFANKSRFTEDEKRIIKIYAKRFLLEGFTKWFESYLDWVSGFA
jgi:hypothetical protein